MIHINSAIKYPLILSLIIVFFGCAAFYVITIAPKSQIRIERTPFQIEGTVTNFVVYIIQNEVTLDNGMVIYIDSNTTVTIGNRYIFYYETDNITDYFINATGR